MSMPLLDLTEETGTLTLEELDFSIGCGHSAHSRAQHHSGDALWVCKAFHSCGPDNGGADGPWVYPACDAWAKHVEASYGKLWICPRCQHGDLTENYVIVVGPLNTT